MGKRKVQLKQHRGLTSVGAVGLPEGSPTADSSCCQPATEAVLQLFLPPAIGPMQLVPPLIPGPGCFNAWREHQLTKKLVHSLGPAYFAVWMFNAPAIRAAIRLALLFSAYFSPTRRDVSLL